tara:strand:- start:670 stop:963 length:294 start_codon:yes stop_codon:yes gene_type:complete
MKQFFIKLISITFAVILVINVVFNLLIADKLDNLNNLLSLSNKENRNELRDKVRIKLEDSLKKDKIFYEEDKVLLYKIYKKINEEFEEIILSDKEQK